MTSSSPSGDAACACTTLRKASRAVSRLYDERFAETGMTLTQYAILKALDRTPGQPLSRLAEAMVMDRTTLYRAVAPMEREGWLCIGKGPGRSRIANMTIIGRRAMADAAPIWAAAQADFLHMFGREHWAQLATTLTRLMDVTGGGSPA